MVNRASCSLNQSRVICLILIFFLAEEGAADATPINISSKRLNQALRQAFPDLGEKGTAHKSVRIRNLYGDYKPTQLSGEMIVSACGCNLIRHDGKRDLLLVIDVSHEDGRAASSWGGETLMALFSLAPKLRLIDVVDIRSDRESGLWETTPVLSGTSFDSPIVYFSHLNAGEEYFGLTMVDVLHNKFVRSQVRFPLIYNGRKAGATIEERPALQIVKQSAKSRASFKVRVTGKLIDEDSQQVKKSQSKTFVTQLLVSEGRWRCQSCHSMAQSINNFARRFGFGSD